MHLIFRGEIQLLVDGRLLFGFGVYRGTSLRRNLHPVGPYSRTMPRLL